MAKRLLELVSNNDGTISRTQLNMWLCHLTSLILIVMEAVVGNIITAPLMAIMCLYAISSHADRMDTRRLQVKLAGAEIELHGSRKEEE